MEQSREYETLYIIAPELTEEGQNALRAKVTDVIKNTGGEIIKDEVWGKRKLAYSIKKKTEGVYVLVRSKGGSNIPTVVDTFVKRTPDVLRHLTTLVTEQQVHEEARQVAAAEKKAELARVAAEEAEKRAADREAAAAAAEADAAAAPVETAPEVVSEESESEPKQEAVGE